MTMLGMPTVPAVPQPRSAGPVTFTAGHHFAVTGATSIEELAEAATVPLSVILQVTKRCNFDRSFCSETLQLPDPTLAELDTIRTNLDGVGRVFLSGGEPLLRKDFGEIVNMYTGDFILGIPTNATRGLQHATSMIGKVAFVNVGIEGPRATTNRVRGDYDQVMAGVRAFQDAGLPLSLSLSLSAVVYRSTLPALPFTYQIADVISAGKLKLILLLRKGNALGLEANEFISVEQAGQAFDRLMEARAVHDWRPALRMTCWTAETEGHMILVEVTGKASAWPVYDAPDLLEPLGNLLREPVSEIWKRYRFKRNHFAKYLGKSIRTAANAGAAVVSEGHADAWVH